MRAIDRTFAPLFALLLLIALAALTLAGSSCGGDARESRSAPAEFDLQGHRGFRGLYPENTLLGFRAALATGVTTLEMDLAVSKDGVVLVHHDEGLNAAIARGPNGRWVAPPTSLLRSLSWQQVQRFDVGRLKPDSRYAARFPQQQGADAIRIPRFADVLSEAEALTDGRMLYNVETKLTPDQPSWTLPPVEFAEAVVREIRAAGVAQRSWVQSFDWRTLRHIAAHHPDIRTVCLTTEQPGEENIGRMQPGPSRWTAGLDLDDYDGSVADLVAAASCAVWSPFHGDLNVADLTRARELGLRVIPWTVNEPEDIEAMLGLGVDGIISDYPDRVRRALEASKLPLPRRFAR